MELSIVVPVYNVAAYLKKTVESLKNQTFNDAEILLIDDGSIDESGVLCDQFAEEDSRVRVFHQINQGVSSARNKGIAEARGKYITFVDSDDWVEADTYSEAMQYIADNSFDVFVFGHTVDEEEIQKKMFLEGNPSLRVIPVDTALSSMLLNRSFNWNMGDKIYRTELVKKHPFNTDIHNGEDLLFHWRVFSEAERIGVFNTCKYHYVQRKGSASHNELSLRSLSVMDVFPVLLKEANENVRPAVESVYLKYCIGFAKRIKMAGIDSEFVPYLNRTMQHVCENFGRILLDSNIPIKHRVGAGLLFLPDAFWKVAGVLLGL